MCGVFFSLLCIFYSDLMSLIGLNYVGLLTVKGSVVAQEFVSPALRFCNFFVFSLSFSSARIHVLICTCGSNVCESFFVFSCMDVSVGKLPARLLVRNKSLRYELSAFLLGTFVFRV